MRRALAAVLSVALPLGPSSSWANVVQSAVAPYAGTPAQPLVLAAPGTSIGQGVSAAMLFSPPGLRLGAPTLGLPSSPGLTLPDSAGLQGAALPVPAVRPAAAVKAPVQGKPTKTASAAPVRERVAALRTAQSEDAVSLKTAGTEGSSSIAEQGFARILDVETPVGTGLETSAADAPVVSRSPWLGWLRPAPLLETLSGKGADVPKPAPVSGLRTFLAGTAVFKIGQDAMAIGMPLLALTAFGSASWAALFAVSWTLSQAVSSSLAGGMVDRRSPVKILSWAMALQAVAIAVMLGLLWSGLASPYLLLALYGLAGGLLGVSDTARQVIPPRLVNGDERALKFLNAKTHTAYEIAGVTSAVLAGLSIKFLGLLPTLMIHPPAYLLAAFLFSRLRLAAGARLQARQALASRPLRDFLDGARTMFSRPMYLWSMAAVIVPLVIHKIFEGLLLPVTAKVLLSDPSAAAWLLGASNFGELLGALVLMRVLASSKAGEKQHSHYWVRIMGLGLLSLWSLALTRDIWILLAFAVVKSLTWIASDLSLRSKLQNSIPEDRRGRALGFMNTLALASILASSLGVGFLLDSMAPLAALYWIAGGISALAAVMLLAARHLRPGRI
ncbi:MAG: hypothetical protein WC728_02120 [Elusimicrobiota bacterium]